MKIRLNWDQRKRRLYILPLPCVGICLDFGLREEDV